MRFLVNAVLALGVVGAGGIVHAAPLTLDQLQAELAKHPEAQWTAGATAAHGQFAGRVNPFGLAKSHVMPSPVLDMARFKTPVGLPTSLDWRNMNGQNFQNPIENQGQCGSCVAFGSIGTLEGQYNIAAQAPGFNVSFSQQSLFSAIGDCADGAEPADALSTLQSTGVPDLACDPYTIGSMGVDSTAAACSDVATRSVKITGSASVSTEQAKQALQSGPLLATMTVYEDFLYYTGGVYKHVAGDVAGGHAVSIVGYDDTAGAWIVRNSWGPEWGEGGFFRIAYNDVSGVGTENYSMTVSSNNYVKVSSPSDYSAVSGPITVTAANPRNATLGSISYTMGIPGQDGQVAGTFDSTMSAKVDTTTLTDGVYVLSASATANGAASLAWYQTVEVVNNPQTITLAMAADGWDETQAATGAVNFTVTVTQSNSAVPLTDVTLEVKAADGTITTEGYPNPGTSVIMPWITNTLANGTYTVWAEGRIGTLQTFESPTSTITVKN